MERNIPKGTSIQHINQGVTIIGCTDVTVGPKIEWVTRKKKKTDKKKKPTKFKESQPLNVKEVIYNHLDRLTFDDAKIIKNSITCSWNDLALKIRTHTNNIKNIDKLSSSEAIQRVLFSWIEEHDDSALVSILVENLWEISQKKAAIDLADRYVARVMTE